MYQTRSMNDNGKTIGIICIIVASVCYGLVPSLSFISFDLGVETETLLFDKFLYATIMLWGHIFLRKINYRLSPKAAMTMLIASIGYVSTSTFLYLAFDYVSGSLATIVSFTYPALIISVEMLFHIEPIRKMKILAVLLSFSGLVLIVWSPDMHVNILGIFFAFCSAFAYATYVFSLSLESIKKESNFVVAGYVTLAAAIVNFIRCLISEKPLFATEPNQIGMMLLLSVVCVFFVIVIYSVGVRHIGPGNAALINTLEPVLACVFGHYLIGDVLTPIMMVGSALVVSAVILTNLPTRSENNLNLKKD